MKFSIKDFFIFCAVFNMFCMFNLKTHFKVIIMPNIMHFKIW